MYLTDVILVSYL